MSIAALLSTYYATGLVVIFFDIRRFFRRLVSKYETVVQWDLLAVVMCFYGALVWPLILLANCFINEPAGWRKER